MIFDHEPDSFLVCKYIKTHRLTGTNAFAELSSKPTDPLECCLVTFVGQAPGLKWKFGISAILPLGTLQEMYKVISQGNCQNYVQATANKEVRSGCPLRCSAHTITLTPEVRGFTFDRHLTFVKKRPMTRSGFSARYGPGWAEVYPGRAKPRLTRTLRKWTAPRASLGHIG